LLKLASVKGNDVYVAFGRTYSGRYLSVYFVYKNENRTAIIITARDMSKKEKNYGKNKLSSISEADSLEKMGKFWDKHDFTDFDTEIADVEFDVSCAAPIELNHLSNVEKQAQIRGVKTETLINLWLQQKLIEQTK
jgi:hypothetical protein